MAYTFSTDQQSIIDSRNQNILVSAAAGSGKTSVLTERIVQLVADPVNPIDIDKILVVTFTNAAAREMKERIAKRLGDMLSDNPENVHLQKQSQLIYNAQITTIDSYCLYLVKNHFHKINVDPVFRVASEGEMKLLKEDVMSEVIKRAYASKDPDFYNIVDCYSKKDNDQTLEDSILKIYTFAMSYPNPKNWLTKCKEFYSFDSITEFENSFYMECVKNDAAIILEKVLSLWKQGKELVNSPEGPNGYQKNVEADEILINGVFDALKTGDSDFLFQYLNGIKFDRLANPKKDVDPCLNEEFKAIRDSYKKILQDLIKDYYFEPVKDLFEDSKAASKTVGKLIDLVLEFMDSFYLAKRERAVVDFTDMEHMAIDILIDKFNDDGTYEITEVAKDLKAFYKEVMVDEYQDSNLVQEILIQSVSREKEASGNNRFMVGDIKQSIYRFRLARPDIFADKTKAYDKSDKAQSRLITLKQNYRSRDSVIDSVNAVFRDVMTQERGKLIYDDDAKLTKAGDFTIDTESNKTEVILLDTEGLKTADFKPYETDAIAAKIKSLVGTMEVYDKETKSLRKASYKDIAVLFRSPSKWIADIKTSFDKLSIPYHMEGVGKFYDTREIKDILSFLQIVDNPLSDIALYSSMTSCFGNFTDEECVYIKAEDENSHYYYWDKLKSFSEKHPENIKVNNFLNLVKRYRGYVKYMPISELIITLFEETGYKNIVAALPDGKQRLANVNMLLLKANEYAKTSFHGLFHFMRYIELIKKVEVEEDEANIFDENSDTVRVLSIHKSKGLEFPVVILGGVESEFNKMDYTAPFVADIDLGIAADFIDPKRRTKRSTIMRKVIVNNMKRENLGEEIRVLYVALTRAKEKLIIFGGMKDAVNFRDGALNGKDNSYLGLMSKTIIENEGELFTIDTPELAKIEAIETSEEVSLRLLKEELVLGAKKADATMYKELKSRLDFVYPYENLSRLYTKTSVSDLKLAAMEEDSEAHHVFEENEPKEYKPSFAGGVDEVKGTARGTAYHNLLQLTDFSRLLECKGNTELNAELNNQIDRIIALKKMPKEDIEIIRRDKIVTFYASNLANRMAKADSEGMLYKEQPFVIGVNANEVEADFPSDETILIQGVIDAFFIEDGEVVLLDYKTDRVDSKEELIKRYKKQLDYYENAISRIMGIKVKEKIIYSFGLNETIVL